jgi:hypothetical protein
VKVTSIVNINIGCEDASLPTWKLRFVRIACFSSSVSREHLTHCKKPAGFKICDCFHKASCHFSLPHDINSLSWDLKKVHGFCTNLTPLVTGITRIGHARYEDHNIKTIIFDSSNTITNHGFLRGSNLLICRLMDMDILTKC